MSSRSEAAIRTGVTSVEPWSAAQASIEVFRYVDISAVDREAKSITAVRTLAVAEAPSRARQLLRANDVLVSTVRPNLNAVALVPEELDGAVASTGFTVLRPNPKKLNARFLFHWVRTPTFVSEMTKKATGASYPAVSDRIVLDSAMPMPSPEEQRRIADILDKADAIRRKRKEAIALTEELLRSAFLDMFGDPMVNPKKWAMRPLGELLLMPLRNGLSPASGGGYPARVLTLSAITRGRFDGKAVKDGFFAVDPWGDVRLDARDFLICRGNGNLAMVGSGAFPSASDASVVFPDTMIAARVDDGVITPSYLTSVWTSALVRRQLEAGARTTNGTYKINQSCIEAIRLPVPGREVQIAFANVAQRVTHALEVQGNTSCEAAALFESLTDRAFNGALRS